MSIDSDNPIRNATDDALGRASVAQGFGRQVLSLDASQGMVVGVLGAWGSGKTSFVNLAREGFAKADVPVLDFNPWMFSGAEQLVESFFIELAAQLKLRPGLAGVADDLADYGEAFSALTWLPVVGPWIDRGRGAAKILSKLLSRRREGISGRRAKLETALAELDQPILVVLDDIDRLSTSEIRDIFKLVRLTASFPNIIYVLAFDRVRVESALAEQGIPGRDYLEKILQVAIDLPAVPDEALNRQIFSAIDAALEQVDTPGQFNEEEWPDVFMEVIRPLVRNMRDVRRYAAAIHGTVGALEGQVALVDVLALEAVRVFMPDTFAQLARSVEGLTTASGLSFGGREDAPHLKTEIDELVGTAGSRNELVRDLVRRLFPAGARHVGGTHFGPDWQKSWLRERRVAHDQILRLYLERVAGEGLRAFRDAESAWESMSDADDFESVLRAVERDRLQDVVAALETYEDQYRPEHVVPGTVVLLNLLTEIPERPRGMFDFEPRMVVGRVTYRLLRSLDDPEAVESAVKEILPQLNSLSAKFELVTDVGYREGAGHKLVSEAAAAKLEAKWRADVRAATPDELAREPDLLRVCIFARLDLPEGEEVLEIPDSPELTRAVLTSALTETRSQYMGSRAVRRSPRLVWEPLVEIYGGEKVLRARVESLKASGLTTDEELLALVDRYLRGWRPETI